MQSSNSEYRIEKMTKEDMKMMIDRAIAEGWTESYDSMDLFYEMDPNGYFKGMIGDEVVSVVSAVQYPDNYAFMGYYIVAPQYRGRGYGLKLFQHALDYCKGCLVGLDAVESRAPTYEKIGFVTSEGSDRYVGTAKKATVPLNVISYEPKHFDDIAEYDKPFFPSQRRDFLKQWLVIPNAKTVVYYNDDHKLQGYGSIHKTNKGWEIAPLYADTREIAKSILIALVNQIDEGSYFGVNCPDTNKDAVDLFNEKDNIYGFHLYFHNLRMYKDGMPQLDIPRSFSVLSLSVG